MIKADWYYTILTVILPRAYTKRQPCCDEFYLLVLCVTTIHTSVSVQNDDDDDEFLGFKLSTIVAMILLYTYPRTSMILSTRTSGQEFNLRPLRELKSNIGNKCYSFSFCFWLRTKYMVVGTTSIWRKYDENDCTREMKGFNRKSAMSPSGYVKTSDVSKTTG